MCNWGVVKNIIVHLYDNLLCSHLKVMFIKNI